MLGTGEIDKADGAGLVWALRLLTIARYNPEEDEFEAFTFYATTYDPADEEGSKVSRNVRRTFGFLYLRALRTGSRALSLERGSLLDVILRIQSLQTGIWEHVRRRLKSLDPPIDDGAKKLTPVLHAFSSRNELLYRDLRARCIQRARPSPFVIERFEPDQIVILRRDNTGTVSGTRVSLPAEVKAKTYRQNLRNGFAEAMLGKAVVVAEGLTERLALQCSADVMQAADNSNYPLDLTGVSIIAADGDGSIAPFGAVPANRRASAS